MGGALLLWVEHCYYGCGILMGGALLLWVGAFYIRFKVVKPS